MLTIVQNRIATKHKESEHEILFLCDEVQSGFGRTGKLFACEYAGISPDIMCVGKALTGGYVSLAATLTNARVRDGISAQHGVLMHGPTFMGNALACSIASANIELLINSDWQQQVSALEQQFAAELAQYSDHPAVSDVRTLGAIGVVELHDIIDVAEAQRRFVEANVWIRPFGKLVYLMPPFIIGPNDVTALTDAVGLILD